jgi:3-isopropylmalate/(R)-2-methylmalate dehydratase small subunit
MAQVSEASAQRAGGERSNTTGVTRIAARACVLRGDDIDTDRIIPARYLRCVTFDGIGEHAFADDREQAKGDHPLDDPRFRGADILVVGRNFGCGSSREHAPQSLMRFGFRAFVGASFAEIFAGNCTALGLPCVTLEEADLEALMDSISLDPAQEVVIDLAARTLTSRAGTVRAGLRDGVRKALLEGSWNATAVLIDAGEAIERTAARIAYVNGFAG